MANLGQYTGYQRDPKNPDRVLFQTISGIPDVAPASSRAAQDLIARFDSQTKPPPGPDNRLADNTPQMGMGVPADVTGLASGRNVATDAVPDFNMEEDSNKSRGATGSFAPAKRDLVPATPASNADRGPPEPVGPQQFQDITRLPDGTEGKFVRGTKGGTVETGGSQVKRGGYEQSPEYIDTRVDALKQELAASQQLETAQSDYAEERQATASLAEQAARKEQAINDAGLAAAKKGKAAQEALLTQAQQDYAQWEEKPDRIFSGDLGTVKRIGAAIAAGLGAFGSALSRTPNYAQEIIDRAIDRDIAAQRAEHVKLKGNVDNAWGRLRDAGATEEQADALLRVNGKQVAAAIAAQQEAKYQGTEAGAKAQAIRAQKVTEVAKEMEQYNIASQGEITKQVNFVVQQARAGGFVPSTMEEKLKRRGLAADVGMKEAELAAGPQGKKDATEKRAEAGLLGAVSAYKRLAEAAGAEIDQSGRLVGGELNSDLPGGDSESTAKQKGLLGVLSVQGGNALNSGAELGQPARDKLGLDLEGVLPKNRTASVSEFGAGLYDELKRRGIDPEAVK